MTNTCSCGRPTSGGPICDTCTTTFTHAIVNVGALYFDLNTVASRSTRTGGIATRGSIGKERPLPVDMRFLDAGDAPDDDKSGRARGATISPGQQLVWDTENTVKVWCDHVAAEQPRLSGPVCPPAALCLHTSCATIRRRRPPVGTVASRIHYIARQFRWLVTQPFAPQMFDEFLNLENRLKRMTDVKPATWYAGRCSTRDPEDGDRMCTAELYATTERGQITCPACGTVHNVADRREFLLDEAKDYLVTATEAAGALLAWTDYDGSENKLVDRIGKWHKRGAIDDRGVTEVNGRWRPLYRLGDLQDLMVTDAQTRQTKRIGGAA